MKMKKFVASIAILFAVLIGIGHADAATTVPTTHPASTPAATPTPATPPTGGPTQVARCTTSFEWIAGQQAHAHVHIKKALRSNADAIKSYPNCGKLSPQVLNVVVARVPLVNKDGAAVYTHWHKVK